MNPHAEDNAPLVSIHGRIYELPDLWNNGDDWTGVTSTAERKKRQNRLNQRAWRRRQKVQTRPVAESYKGAPTKFDDTANAKIAPAAPDTSHQSSEWQYQHYSLDLVDEGVDVKGALLLRTPTLAARARELIRAAYNDHMLHAPRVETLHMLIRLNLLNALATNAMRMGFPVEGLCRDEFVSPFNSLGPLPVGSTSAITTTNCPASLQPTRLQCVILHHPWIDLIPFAGLRDNMLRVLDAGLFDDDDLCSDVLEVWGDDLDSRPSLVIWGDPWDCRAWEASPAFLEKWGWLIKDSPELIDATNFWREKRGQRRLTMTATAGPTNETVEAFAHQQRAKGVQSLSILHE